MRVAILQPSYLPWLGYFEQLAFVDYFLFLDDVQYTRSDWRNRNRIKTSRGPAWISVPVRRTGLTTQIREALVDYTPQWPQRHLNLLHENYRKAPYYTEVCELVRPVLEAAPSHLADLCISLIKACAAYIGINTPTGRSSALALSGQDPNDRLIRLCQTLGATEFYEGRAGMAYLDLPRFAEAGIRVTFQDYAHPVYPQLHGSFLSHLSVIDLLCLCGPASASVIASGHTSTFTQTQA